MTKISLKILSLILMFTALSCKKELETLIETDYKVIEFEYGFDNYMNNFRSESDPFIIKERNIVIINTNKDGMVTIEDSFVEDSLITTELLKYIIPSPENEKMPITIEKEFELSGKVIVNKNLIILAKFNEKLEYEKYRNIRKSIYSAYNKARNEFSIKKFDKNLMELINSSEEDDITKWREIRQAIPIQYTEIVQ
ncbi:hypothetical protein [uncultured Psychroserpens sp.]|uniref:hypothetical protein n=1 Tax=uncultured Psychroserpens sp. TaxID=255436 RepID=UPI002607A3C3|nr:hypothetical protein [uncultured Psychroserpens sp.]